MTKDPPRQQPIAPAPMGRFGRSAAAAFDCNAVARPCDNGGALT